MAVSPMSEYTNTGINTGIVPWGTHISSFHHTQSDLTDLAVPYLAAGLEANEKCVALTGDTLDSETLLRSLEGAGICLNPGSGQVCIIDYADWYLKAGRLSLGKAIGKAESVHARALSEGYDGFRLIGNLSWLDDSVWTQFMDYEERIDKIIRRSRILAVCAYSMDGCEEGIGEVLKYHQYAIRRGDVWTIQSIPEEHAAAAGLVRAKQFRDSLLRPALEGHREELLASHARFKHSTQGLEDWTTVHEAWRASQDLARNLQDWGSPDGLSKFSHTTISALFEDLKEVYTSNSEDVNTRITAGERQARVRIRGCPGIDACRASGDRVAICHPDLMLSALLLALGGTPTSIQTQFSDDACLKRVSPAWLVEILGEFAGHGVRGLLVMRGQRVMFHFPGSEQDSKALSQALVEREELANPGDGFRIVESFGAKLLSVANGDVYVCLTVPLSTTETDLRLLADRINRSIAGLA